MFEDKKVGIFGLLDEECRMPNPQTTSFMRKLRSNHGSAFDTRANTQYEFAIHHFGYEVLYTTVRCTK